MADGELRLDDLAREAGVPSTTIRLYRQRGLLAPPRLEGRTGWFDESHLARLRLIARLQDEGFSLAGIGRLLESYEQGVDLAQVVGAEVQLDQVLHAGEPITLSVAELLARFDGVVMIPEAMQRAGSMGLLEMTDEGDVRVPDRRFVDAGAALARLGLPLDVILDEWAHLAEVADGVAARFVGVFEAHVLPHGWRPGDELPAGITASMETLRTNAGTVVAAALDGALARAAATRLAELAAAPAKKPRTKRRR